MARPIKYEATAVLNNAMEQFWREGYDASSVQKLLDCTGLNRGSLYNSFGSKELFFKSCIDQYNSHLGGQINETLKNDDMGCWESIDAFFRVSILEASNRQRQLGCLLVNSICGSMNQDREIKRVLRASLTNIRRPLVQRLRKAEKKGKLKTGLTAESAAEILLNMMYGVRVNSRDGKSTKQLKDLIDFTIASLKN